jgi:hypothetical protein
MTNLELADLLEKRRAEWLSHRQNTPEYAHARQMLEDSLKANLEHIIGALRGEVRFKTSELYGPTIGGLGGKFL